MPNPSITVAETVAGPPDDHGDSTPVSLSVEDLLQGRGFFTGISGSGKSNSVAVVAEELFDPQCRTEELMEGL